MMPRVPNTGTRHLIHAVDAGNCKVDFATVDGLDLVEKNR